MGISIDRTQRRVEDGMLYQTQHYRLQDGWQLYFGIDGIDSTYLPKIDTVRFGGEARMASITKQENITLPKATTAKNNCLMLYLLTPLADTRSNSQQPPLPHTAFTPCQYQQADAWQGMLVDIPVTIISAIVGKAQRYGGWDMAAHQSLPVQSYLPAGSCWYLQTDTTEQAQQLIDRLHLGYISQGHSRAQGYGQIALGNTPTH
ncbi:CRISPR type III-B/RAMP module-associated protein Cmr3 [Suttonella ornithocola]|uniref:CRISPR type III-B/RAMP module-associated protein Cmr3 n=1 Tax=Suttonella ornithocola TaxID=279832 RepID=A0A380MWV4_9GAMM|nr:CRISPR type III-B/RAMP module-associated protein Cmr3 [Suttonella ornithocola]